MAPSRCDSPFPQLQWFPPTVYPNLLASLGIEGRFKLWAEDPSAPPGQRFSSRGANGKAAYESRSPRAPYRSFSLKHDEATRCTYFALLASDGHLSVHESEEPEAIADYAKIDSFQACAKPTRGEETCFKVRFDPNPEPCYTALRAGVPTDALGLVVAGMAAVKVFRTRDTVTSSFGAATRAREFYLAVEITAHKGLVRDVAWAPGNFRGYDMIATACQDGFVRVFRIDAPLTRDDGKTWSVADVTGARGGGGGNKPDNNNNSNSDEGGFFHTSTNAPSNKSGGGGGARARALSHPHSSGIRAEIDKSGTHGERTSTTGQPGQIAHRVKELSKLDLHRTPVWRVGFDDDGQILGSVGDDGRLICYRQTPDQSWAKSSELGIMKTRMGVAP